MKSLREILFKTPTRKSNGYAIPTRSDSYNDIAQTRQQSHGERSIARYVEQHAEPVQESVDVDLQPTSWNRSTNERDDLRRLTRSHSDANLSTNDLITPPPEKRIRQTVMEIDDSSNDEEDIHVRRLCIAHPETKYTPTPSAHRRISATGEEYRALQIRLEASHRSRYDGRCAHPLEGRWYRIK